MTAQSVPFDKAATDETGGNPKVQRRHYLPAGALPIIDQGQTEIAGYTDDLELAYRGELPVVLFGDHTRALKYVDQPFALGADGVKVLQPRDGFSAKFLYYHWLSSDIPNHGYSRHFKFLKEISVPVFAPTEQRRIVEILDQADALRKLRREADAKVARILPALFLKMFGDPATNPMGWPVKALGAPDVCEINPRAERGLEDDLEVSFVPMADVDEHLGRIVGSQTRPVSQVRKGFTAFRENDVLFAKITPCMQNGKAAIATDLKNGLGYGSTEFHVLQAQQGIAPEWVFTLVRLQTFRDQARAAFTGSAGQQRVPSTFFKSYHLPIPSPQAMSKFANAAQETFRILEACDALTAKVDKIFALLLQRAFSGQLTAKWRAARAQELLAEMQEQVRVLGLTMSKEMGVTP